MVTRASRVLTLGSVNTCVQVLYNPDEVSYQQLLEVFTSIHNPTQLNRQV